MKARRTRESAGRGTTRGVAARRRVVAAVAGPRVGVALLVARPRVHEAPRRAERQRLRRALLLEADGALERRPAPVPVHRVVVVREGAPRRRAVRHDVPGPQPPPPQLDPFFVARRRPKDPLRPQGAALHGPTRADLHVRMLELGVPGHDRPRRAGPGTAPPGGDDLSRRSDWPFVHSQISMAARSRSARRATRRLSVGCCASALPPVRAGSQRGPFFLAHRSVERSSPRCCAARCFGGGSCILGARCALLLEQSRRRGRGRRRAA